MFSAISPFVQAAEVLVAVCGLAATTTSTDMFGSVVKSADGLRRFAAGLPEDARSVPADLAQALKAALEDPNHLLPQTSRTMIPQMIEQAPVTGVEVFQCGRDARAIVDLMLGKLTDPAHAPALLRDDFRRIVTPLLDQVLNDPEITRVLEAAFQRFVAQALEEIERKTSILVGRSSEDTRNLGLLEGLVIGLARRIAEDVQDTGTALKELERAIAVAAEKNRPGEPGSSGGDQLAAVQARMKALNDRGDLDGAAQVVDDRLARDDEQRLVLLETAIRQQILCRDPVAVARRLWEKLQIEVPDPAPRFAALRAVQASWYAKGRDKGLNLDAEVAVQLARTALDLARNRAERGAAQNDLGKALYILGDRKTDPAMLSQAASRFREAGSEWSEPGMERDWAISQNNLGAALMTLGSRTRDLAVLDEAVAVLRIALALRSRDLVPFDWAMTLANIAITLRRAGCWGENPGKIEEAVALYPEVLAIRTRAHDPGLWSDTQESFGNALRELGKRTPGTALLDEARDAYQAAFLYRRREDRPLDWARTSNNVARLELEFFDKTRALVHLDRARSHAEEALSEFLRLETEEYANRAQEILDRVALAHEQVKTPGISPD